MEAHSAYEFKDNLVINIIRTNDVKRHFYSYTEYVLEFKVLNSQKILKKRFSDFVTFYDQLKNEFLVNFSENLEKISVLPSKKVFGRLNYNFVEE
ncbi:phosphoinositide-binding protein, putative [Plasmodium ovale curtisi]|nr:phosphoinositide-binding protein, putative [Plasmodium ovale curtisi]SBS81044.1 phosphoinositide-binding protein, putative [Plasmodium ovale curtisi]